MGRNEEGVRTLGKKRNVDRRETDRAEMTRGRKLRDYEGGHEGNREGREGRRERGGEETRGEELRGGNEKMNVECIRGRRKKGE